MSHEWEYQDERPSPVLFGTALSLTVGAVLLALDAALPFLAALVLMVPVAGAGVLVWAWLSAGRARFGGEMIELRGDAIPVAELRGITVEHLGYHRVGYVATLVRLDVATGSRALSGIFDETLGAALTELYDVSVQERRLALTDPPVGA